MNNSIRFRRYAEFRHGIGTDLTEDKFLQKIVAETLRRYLDIDYSKARVSGWLSEGDSLQVCIRHKGAVVRTIYLDCLEKGWVFIDVSSMDALKKDLAGDVASYWLQKLGFPPDYPYGEEVKVIDGRLTIQIDPCF